MNRFDDSFNDIDATTGRPFSRGHPDGVWIIAIVYSLIAIGQVLMAMPKLKTQDDPKLAMQAAMQLAGALVMFLPPIPLLFRRSVMAMWWLILVAFVVLLGAGFEGVRMYRSDTLTTGMTGALAVGVLVQGYIALYGWRLKRDGLLT